AVLRIERFWSMKEEQDYKDFLKKTFKELKNRNIENLILDLRNNEGGEETYGILLYSYLTDKPFHYYKKITVAQKKKITVDAYLPKFYGIYKLLFLKKSGSEYQFKLAKFTKKYNPQQNAFKGKVYTLINGNSFSVTTEFSSILHNNKRSTFIGRETGGAYYGDNSGVFGIVVLPESKLVMGIPMLAFYSNVADYPYPDRGIIPDHIITPTIEDIIQEKDPEMIFTLELINKD
ncbi:MAG TPA: S41 family peptidase, partial [Cytophagales bacterium]|nr:S41 family peptidase [Cytophagales bacterium]